MKHLGRKFYHTVGGVGLLSLYFLLESKQAFMVYGVLLVLVLFVEMARLNIPAVNRFFFDRFSSFIRKNEADRLTGTFWYLLGIAGSLALYTPGVAAAAVCFLAFGDVAAATIGERYGKRKIGHKSVEGTIAFLVAGVGAGLLLLIAGIAPVWWVMLVGVLIAAGVELLPVPVNDNLSIPIVSGGVMELIMGLAS